MPSGGEIGPGDRSFNLGESEVTFAASVDPYFTAALTMALSAEGEIGVEEAFARTTSLPAGFSVKGGRFFSGFGYLNEIHAHAWDFVDQPLVYQAFYGGQYGQDGVQVKWLAPTDLFLEFGAETGNGGEFPGTRLGRNGLNGTTLFTHVGGDLGDSIGWRAGLSWMDMDAEDRAYEDVDSAWQCRRELVYRQFRDVDRRRDVQVDAGVQHPSAGLQAAGGVHAPHRGRVARLRRRRRGAQRLVSQRAGRLVRAGRVPVQSALALRRALRRTRRGFDAHRPRPER